MLIPVTAADIPDFTAACAHERIFGSRALTALRAYGLGDPSARFFLCRKGREPAAALYLAGDVLTISSDERADPALIADLARRSEVHEIDTNWAQCQALQALLGGTTESLSLIHICVAQPCLQIFRVGEQRDGIRIEYHAKAGNDAGDQDDRAQRDLDCRSRCGNLVAHIRLHRISPFPHSISGVFRCCTESGMPVA